MKITNNLVGILVLTLIVTAVLITGLFINSWMSDNVTSEYCYKFYARSYCYNHYPDNDGRYSIDIEGYSFTCDAGDERLGSKMNDKYYFKSKEINNCEIAGCR